MKKILFVMLSTLICATLFADNASQIIYSEDSLSAELKITSADFDGEEHFWTFALPANKTIKVTRINSVYFKASNDMVISLLENEVEDIIRANEKFNLGVFIDTLVNASSFTFLIDNIPADYSYLPKDPAITIRFAVIEAHPSTESILLNGDVEVVSGAFSTSGYQDFMGTKVTAILGDDYNEYTCFGSARGGMIRGSNEGYLILSGNPNGYGNRNVYINRYTSNGDVIMTAGSGQVGIGVDDPKEKLHVNGAIRGNGTNGAVTLKGDSGYVTIGATSQTMEFNTDKNKFVFNKPINGSGSYGSLNITTSTGYLEFGPMDLGYVRFKTNMSTYHFDRRLLLQTGELTSATKFTFVTNNSTHCMTMLTNGNIGIGTSSPNYKLDVNGTIRANEIIVNTTGADFVFAEDYKLRPLSEVKAFIQENKHLPEIKSAQEMQENGVGINELQTQLLQKIEELTLYIIQQEERIKQQDLRIKALEQK